MGHLDLPRMIKNNNEKSLGIINELFQVSIIEFVNLDQAMPITLYDLQRLCSIIINIIAINFPIIHHRNTIIKGSFDGSLNSIRIESGFHDDICNQLIFEKNNISSSYFIRQKIVKNTLDIIRKTTKNAKKFDFMICQVALTMSLLRLALSKNNDTWIGDLSKINNKTGKHKKIIRYCIKSSNIDLMELASKNIMSELLKLNCSSSKKSSTHANNNRQQDAILMAI